MSEIYATVADYRLLTGDDATEERRISVKLKELSARLRAEAGLTEADILETEDQKILARSLVCDAAHKGLKPPLVDGIGDVTGLDQASFSANGFMGSFKVSNPTSSCYFDRSMLRELRRLLGKCQAIFSIMPKIGGDEHAR